MRSTQLIQRSEQFWKAVRLCLEEFYAYPPNAAKRRISEYIKVISPTGNLSDEDVVYHYEPFNLASDLAGQDMNIEDHRDEYAAIIRRATGPDKTAPTG